MDDATQSAENIKADIEALRNRFITIDANERCSRCRAILVTRQFYAFPCQHTFHADCLIAMVCMRPELHGSGWAADTLPFPVLTRCRRRKPYRQVLCVEFCTYKTSWFDLRSLSSTYRLIRKTRRGPFSPLDLHRLLRLKGSRRHSIPAVCSWAAAGSFLPPATSCENSSFPTYWLPPSAPSAEKAPRAIKVWSRMMLVTKVGSKHLGRRSIKFWPRHAFCAR